MKPVVIVEKSPLPAVSGNRQRIWHLVRAVHAFAAGDLVVVGELSAFEEECLARELSGWTVHRISVDKRTRDLLRRVDWIARRRLPTGLAVLDIQDALDELHGILGPAPRLIVAIRSTPILLAMNVRRPVDRLVYDLDDAEDVKLQRMSAERRAGSTRPHRWSRVRDRVDVQAWRRFQATAVRRSDLTFVCSPADQRRFSEFGNVDVVPNGTDLGLGSPRVPTRAVLLFVGQLSYGPNERAAVRLATSILPKVRHQLPNAVVRLVGAHGAVVADLGTIDGVEVAGFVEDLEAEWMAASVLVVPLSSGGGTRIKILEAFARSVPVVSTSVGAEGIAALDGEHLLVADTDEGLAAAITRVLEDERLAERLAAAGRALAEQRYDWEMIEKHATQRLQQLTSTD